MRRAVMPLRHAVSILLLPTTVTVVVPRLILGSQAVRPAAAWGAAGALLGAVGLVLVGRTIRHFATVGRGTLAPWDPPRRLVVHGIYRHVRNPMITGVILVLAGEALAFQSRPLAGWALLFAAINATYIPLLEEPMLENRFGDDYREYCRNVPRWIPRLEPWNPQP